MLKKIFTTIFIIFILISIFIFIFINDILKYNMEKIVSGTINKEVKIGELYFSILDSKININNIKVIDRKETINIENISIDIDMYYLLSNKIIIENLLVDEIQIKKKLTVDNDIQVKSNYPNKSDSIDYEVYIKETINSDLVTVIEKLAGGNIQENINKYKNALQELNKMLNSNIKIETIKNNEFVNEQVNLENKVATPSVPINELERPINIRSNGSKMPYILIKNGSFSFLDEDNNIINGSFQDFTTNQKDLNKPFNATIKFSKYKIDKYFQKNITIYNLLLNSKVSLELLNNNIKSNIDFNIHNMDISINSNEVYATKMNEYLNGIKGFKGNIYLYGDIENPDIKVNSNMDEIIEQRTKHALQDIIKPHKIQKAINQNINKEIKEQYKTFRSFMRF
jgi:hypothetical protein